MIIGYPLEIAFTRLTGILSNGFFRRWFHMNNDDDDDSMNHCFKSQLFMKILNKRQNLTILIFFDRILSILKSTLELNRSFDGKCISLLCELCEFNIYSYFFWTNFPFIKQQIIEQCDTSYNLPFMWNAILTHRKSL